MWLSLSSSSLHLGFYKWSLFSAFFMDFEPLKRGLCHNFPFLFHRVSSILKSSSPHIITWLTEFGISNILKDMQLGMMSLMISWPYFSLVRQHVLVERISIINSYSLKKHKWTKPWLLPGCSLQGSTLSTWHYPRLKQQDSQNTSKWVLVLKVMTQPERGKNLQDFRKDQLNCRGKVSLDSSEHWNYLACHSEQSFGIKVDSSLFPFNCVVIYHLPTTDLISKEPA